MALVQSQYPCDRIAGLTRLLDNTALHSSQAMYNEQSEIEQQLPFEDVSQHLQNLAEICGRYGLEQYYCLHLIHRHCELPKDMVMVGTEIEEAKGIWFKPGQIHEVDPATTCGVVFKVDKGHCLAPIKFLSATKSSTNMIKATFNEGFFREFAKYVAEHDLRHTIGLGVVQQGLENMIEFDFGDCGTVSLKANEVRHGSVTHVTEWTIARGLNGVISCKGNTAHAPTTRGPHKVFIDSKLVQDDEALKALLQSYGVFAAPP